MDTTLGQDIAFWVRCIEEMDDTMMTDEGYHYYIDDRAAMANLYSLIPKKDLPKRQDVHYYQIVFHDGHYCLWVRAYQPNGEQEVITVDTSDRVISAVITMNTANYSFPMDSRRGQYNLSPKVLDWRKKMGY